MNLKKSNDNDSLESSAIFEININKTTINIFKFRHH